MVRRIRLWFARWRWRCAHDALRDALALPKPGEEFIQARHAELIDYERLIASLST